MNRDIRDNHELYRRTMVFPGTVFFEAEQISELRFTLTYSELNRSQPGGHIEGRRKDYLALKELFQRAAGGFRFASKSSDRQPFVHSDKCTLTSVEWGFYWTETDVYTIARFTCIDLTIEDDVSNEDITDKIGRSMIFRIDGAYDAWPLIPSLEWSIMSEPQPLNFGSERFNTEIRMVRLPEKAPENKYWHLFAPQLIVQCSTDLSENECGGAGFKDACIRYVDDLCLLVSMLAGSFSYWFSLRYESATDRVEYIRAMANASIDPEIYPELVERWDREAFLRVALPKLRQLRIEGKDVKEAINYYVSASRAVTLEARFAYGFLALEKLVDVFKEDLGLKSNLSGQEFRRLKAEVTQLITSNGYAGQISEQIKAKIDELNRPALKHIATKLITQEIEEEHQGVFLQWLTRIVEARNRLFHRSETVDLNKLARQSFRLQVMLCLLLLRLLGWREVINPRYVVEAQGSGD